MTIAAKRLQDNFSRAAGRYDAHAWLQRQQVARVLATAQQYLPAQARIADIGCGTGFFAAEARALQPAWHITGIDYAYDMAREAAIHCAAVVQGNGAQLPLADASVDGVVSSLCLQWVGDKAAMLAETRRVLKPGGTAIIMTVGNETLEELQDAVRRSDMPLGLLAMESFDTYRALAKASGMQVLACQRTREIHHYASVESLLVSMRSIGAGNAGEKQFIAPKKFAKLIQQYEAMHGTKRGIPATWEPILMVMKNV